jgi:glycosyltransferase 2 family protein
MDKKKLGKFIVSIFLILLIIAFLDFSKFYETILSINIFILPILFAMVLANIILYIISYWVLLEKKVSLKKNVFDYLIVWSFGLFLPGKIGELGIIPILKKKYNISLKKAAFAVVLPKAVIFGVFLFVAALFVYSKQILIFGVLACLFFIFIILFIFFKEKLIYLMKKLVPKKYLSLFNQSGLKSVDFVVIVILGFFRFLILIIFTYLTFIAFGVLPELGWIAFAIAISQITTFIPISLNGLGLREVTFVGLMQLSGISVEIATSAIILSFIANYSLALISIIFWNLKKS